MLLYLSLLFHTTFSTIFLGAKTRITPFLKPILFSISSSPTPASLNAKTSLISPERRNRRPSKPLRPSISSSRSASSCNCCRACRILSAGFKCGSGKNWARFGGSDWTYDGKGRVLCESPGGVIECESEGCWGVKNGLG